MMEIYLPADGRRVLKEKNLLNLRKTVRSIKLPIPAYFFTHLKLHVQICMSLFCFSVMWIRIRIGRGFGGERTRYGVGTEFLLPEAMQYACIPTRGDLGREVLKILRKIDQMK